MDVVYVRCAGMDISKKDVKVCVRVAAPGGRTKTESTTWGAVSSQILALGDYLLEQRVECVVMEATGDYWKPFYHLLGEAGLDVVLANARSVRQIPGRKTDVADAAWLADLCAHGLVRGSFVPPAPIRELKDLVRARTIMVRLRGQEAQRLEKLLESAAIKLSSTISNILGSSGRRIVEAMIQGRNDPAALAGLGGSRLKASKNDLAEALTGRFTAHHAFLAQLHLDTIDGYTTQINSIDERIGTYFDPKDDDSRAGADLAKDLEEARKNLTTIPGVSQTVAEVILSEIGCDLSSFHTPEKLTSWAGVAPGSNESAGKVKSSRCRPGNTYLKGALGIAALAATNTKNTFLRARYQRIARRRGHVRALVATERAILKAVWHILTTGLALTVWCGPTVTV